VRGIEGGVVFLLFFVGVFQHPNALRAQDTAVQSRPYISYRAYRHIVERHWPDSQALAAGKFMEGINRRQLYALIDEATSRGQPRTNTNGRPGQIFEYDFGRTIGSDTQGNPTSRLRVVVGSRNQVVTAFPY
jgi:hypothetical protein